MHVRSGVIADRSKLSQSLSCTKPCVGSRVWIDAENAKEITILRRTTLKAFASSSPGFALNPWVTCFISRRRNSEGVASPFANYKAVATPSELRTELRKICCGSFEPQGFKTNPGPELANAFSVIRRTFSFSHNLYRD
jgi:hypothetical protein